MNQILKVVFTFVFVCAFTTKELMSEDRPLPWPWPFQCIPTSLSGSWSGIVNRVALYDSYSNFYDQEYELSVFLKKDTSFSGRNSSYKEFEVQIGFLDKSVKDKIFYYFSRKKSSKANSKFFQFLEVNFYTEKGERIFYPSSNSYNSCHQNMPKTKQLELKFRKPYVQSDSYSTYDKVRFYFDVISEDSE